MKLKVRNSFLVAQQSPWVSNFSGMDTDAGGSYPKACDSKQQVPGSDLKLLTRTDPCDDEWADVDTSTVVQPLVQVPSALVPKFIAGRCASKGHR